MNCKKSKNRLDVRLDSDFNLNTVRTIKNLMEDREELHMELENTHFVNSEAIIYLHDLIQNQKKVRLRNPPKVFFEAIKILGLHEIWDLDTIVEP